MLEANYGLAFNLTRSAPYAPILTGRTSIFHALPLRVIFLTLAHPKGVWISQQYDA